MNATTSPKAPDPIKLSNERVREMLIESSSRGPLDVWSNREVAALAQNVLDLRTATMALEGANDGLVHDAMKLVATIETMRAELEDDRRVIRELTARCEALESREDCRASSVAR